MNHSGSEGCTVLVVDDSPAMLDLVRECLDDEGYRVVTCLQGKDALGVAKTERPQVIMLDLVMPEVSGWEVLDALGKDSDLAKIPVIITTAYVAEALGRLAELQGPTGSRLVGLLPKPFDTEELLEIVSSITGGDRPAPVELRRTIE